MSLESADMAYLLKLNEYLDIEEFITDVNEREEELKAKSAPSPSRPRRGGRG